ncbi:hypothetical protein C8J57DRAFT_1583031 [Mycena rebaudengoi]|nr:hypothetical protein C8J57DRAFT_1583031 [Mycena rebaudengoi]
MSAGVRDPFWAAIRPSHFIVLLRVVLFRVIFWGVVSIGWGRAPFESGWGAHLPAARHHCTPPPRRRHPAHDRLRRRPVHDPRARRPRETPHPHHLYPHRQALRQRLRRQAARPLRPRLRPRHHSYHKGRRTHKRSRSRRTSKHKHTRHTNTGTAAAARPSTSTPATQTQAPQPPPPPPAQDGVPPSTHNTAAQSSTTTQNAATPLSQNAALPSSQNAVSPTALAQNTTAPSSPQNTVSPPPAMPKKGGKKASPVKGDKASPGSVGATSPSGAVSPARVEKASPAKVSPGKAQDVKASPAKSDAKGEAANAKPSSVQASSPAKVESTPSVLDASNDGSKSGADAGVVRPAGADDSATMGSTPSATVDTAASATMDTATSPPSAGMNASVPNTTSASSDANQDPSPDVGTTTADTPTASPNLDATTTSPNPNALASMTASPSKPRGAHRQKSGATLRAESVGSGAGRVGYDVVQQQQVQQAQHRGRRKPKRRRRRTRKRLHRRKTKRKTEPKRASGVCGCTCAAVWVLCGVCGGERAGGGIFGWERACDAVWDGGGDAVRDGHSDCGEVAPPRSSFSTTPPAARPAHPPHGHLPCEDERCVDTVDRARTAPLILCHSLRRVTTAEGKDVPRNIRPLSQVSWRSSPARSVKPCHAASPARANVHDALPRYSVRWDSACGVPAIAPTLLVLPRVPRSDTARRAIQPHTRTRPRNPRRGERVPWPVQVSPEHARRARVAQVQRAQSPDAVHTFDACASPVRGLVVLCTSRGARGKYPGTARGPVSTRTNAACSAAEPRPSSSRARRRGACILHATSQRTSASAWLLLSRATRARFPCASI